MRGGEGGRGKMRGGGGRGKMRGGRGKMRGEEEAEGR